MMKRFLSLLIVAVLAGIFTLGTYKLFMEPTTITVSENPETSNYIPTNYTPTMNTTAAAVASAIDFSEAAEKTVNAVVHVKHYDIKRAPRNLMEYFRNSGVQKKQITGAGSGVIITPDGYIVTNNHVIAGASELEVTLNNNKTYKAEVIGSAPKADIALIKIDADEDLSYIPFGDSNSAKVGEWVLAVGNPFNLTSTVTAGIISAKSRDLNENDRNYQSFIQTDAAINPGNSGGALVNTKGELIGINTAITSQTGSYVGYAFAVPSNNAKKIVDDLIEFGDVQQGILGVSIAPVNETTREKYNISDTQGVIVSDVSKNSGAEKAGIQNGDLIKQIDGINIKKFADLSGYVSSKRPNDVIQVKINRDGRDLTVPVKLTKYEIQQYRIEDIGLEITTPNKEYLKKWGVNHGVVISDALTSSMKRYNLEGLIITEIDGIKVNSAVQVEKIFKQKGEDENITISLIDRNGEKREFIFQ
ncbi:trypsin-like peptidase domain-containing protein [Aquimarina rhabdastrellae]